MTPFRQQLPDVDWKEATGFLAFIATLGAILRFLFMPLIASTLRTILKKELDKFEDAGARIEKCVTAFEKLEEEVHEIAEIANANRDWMEDTYHLLDHIWNIDRRAEGEERRHLPPLPRYPERRRRPRRREEQ